jgi:hypothetical protein
MLLISPGLSEAVVAGLAAHPTREYAETQLPLVVPQRLSSSIDHQFVVDVAV